MDAASNDRDMLAASQWLAQDDNLQYCRDTLTNFGMQFFRNRRKAQQVAEDVLFDAATAAIRGYRSDISENFQSYLDWKLRFAIMDTLRHRRKGGRQVCVTDVEATKRADASDGNHHSVLDNRCETYDLIEEIEPTRRRTFDEVMTLLEKWGLSELEQRLLVLKIGWDYTNLEIARRFSCDERTIRRMWAGIEWLLTN